MKKHIYEKWADFATGFLVGAVVGIIFGAVLTFSMVLAYALG